MTAIKKIDFPTLDLTGRSFGKWSVIEYVGKHRMDVSGNKSTNVSDVWLCECQCGKRAPQLKGNLLNGLTTQCFGCSRANRARNPFGRKSSGWAVWKSRVLSNCVPEWRDFTTYKVWRGTQPSGPISLLDPSLPHGPDNSVFCGAYQSSHETLRLAIDVLVQRGVPVAEATERMTIASRQRRHQVICRGASGFVDGKRRH